MTDVSDLRDRVGECLPRAIGLAPKSRGRGQDAARASLADDYTVVVSPPLQESFFLLFEHSIAEQDLEGMPLFSRATAASDLSLGEYRTHASLRAFALAARDTMAGRGLVRWTQIVRAIASRLRGDPAPFHAQAHAACRNLGDLRRRVLDSTDFSPDFAARLERQRPFIVIGNQLLVEMRPQWDFCRAAATKDIVDVTLLPEPWFDPIVTTLCTELADDRDDLERAADEKFCAELAAARAPIRGSGELHGFAVSAPSPAILKVSLETGGPLFMEISPGNVVLWPAAVVSVEAEASMLLGPRTDLSIRLSLCPGSHGRTPAARSAEASSLPRIASHLSQHPFASREMTLCVGSTSQRNRQLAHPSSIADGILDCQLRGALRVFRYGWRGSNQNRVYHDLRGNPPPAGVNVIPLAEALQYVAAHPQIELVRWQQ